MKIVFVGIHNKEGKAPLCSTTRTGKVIDKIITKINGDFQFEKMNLFDVDYLPIAEERKTLLAKFKANIQPDTYYIGLGQLVGKWLMNNISAHFSDRYTHPSYYLRFHAKNIDDYIDSLVNGIQLLETFKAYNHLFPNRFKAGDKIGFHSISHAQQFDINRPVEIWNEGIVDVDKHALAGYYYVNVIDYKNGGNCKMWFEGSDLYKIKILVTEKVEK